MQPVEKWLTVLSWLVPIVILGSVLLPLMVRVLREYERGVIFRLGKLLRAKGPGLVLLIPVVDRMVKVDLRVVTIDVPKQEMMSRDNVPVTVDAVVYFRLVDPESDTGGRERADDVARFAQVDEAAATPEHACIGVSARHRGDDALRGRHERGLDLIGRPRRVLRDEQGR